MENQLEKILGISKEVAEQVILDKELFIKLFPLFDSMSQRGKYVTIETLLMYLDLEKEE